MRKFLPQLLIVLATFGNLATADARGLNIDQNYGNIGNWAIGYSDNIGGCLAKVEYNNRTMLWLGLGSAEFGAFIALTNPNWDWVTIGKSYQLRVELPPYGQWKGEFTGFRGGDYPGLIFANFKTQFLYDFVRAREAVFSEGIGRLDLTLSGRAVQALIQCQSARGNPEGTAPEEAAPKETKPKEPAERPTKISTGTGFFVSNEGDILTNFHVIEGCSVVAIWQVGAGYYEEGIVKSVDTKNDLALVTSKIKPAAVPAWNAGVRLGETVAVYGFPLSGTLTHSGNFTIGNVSAVAGPNDDTSWLQISAPIQPGNSGGPLLDQTGNVVGVINAQLKKEFLAQNVNFAIKAGIAVGFLAANDLKANTSPDKTPISPDELAARAKKFTVQILCQPR
ncbi:MAG: serine protease [Hyphomicrobiales bacterium]|nr:MAG: serine protease [Hyphomicrobiales bacterium]